jgi:hypothetical protein
VLDILREGVLKPDVYDPAVNPLYRDMLAHYGCVALPCRVGHSDRKGKVESGVGHAKKTPLKGLRFESFAEAQTYLDRWEERWADTRIHGTTKRQVPAMFAEEKPALQPLPLEPFRYDEYGERRVHLDGCIEIAAAYYSAPPGLDWPCRPRAMGRSPGPHHRPAYGPTAARASAPGTRPALDPAGRSLAQSTAVDPTAAGPLQAAGRNIGALCQALHHRDGEIAVRRILGILSLAKKHGASSVDAACATALEVNHSEYRFVRRYLERQPAPPVTLRQVDPIIRQLTLYRNLIAEKTQENQP